MTDDNLIPQDTVTKTADFVGAVLDLGSPASIETPMWVRVRYNAAANASGSNSIQFQLYESDDNSTFTVRKQLDPIALSTTAKQGILYIPLLGASRYLKLGVDFTGAGSGATVTYDADIVLSLN